MLPVGGVRLDKAGDVGEDVADRLGPFRGRGREPGEQGTRLHARQDREILDLLQVVREEVHGGMGGSPELARAHVAQAAALGGIQAVEPSRTEPGRETGRVGPLRHASRCARIRSSSFRRAAGSRSPKRA